MRTAHVSFRLSEQAMQIIDQHQRRNKFTTKTESLEDIILSFGKSQQSRIKKLLQQKEPEIRLLLSDFLPKPEVQPYA